MESKEIKKGDWVHHLETFDKEIGSVISLDGDWPHGNAKVRWPDGTVISHTMDNLGLVLKKKPKAIDLPNLNSSIDVIGQDALDDVVSHYEQYIGQELTDICVLLPKCKVESIDVTVFDTDVVDDNGDVYDYCELYLYVRCPMGNQHMVNGALIYFYRSKKGGE